MKNNIYNPKVTIIITSKNYDKFLKNSVNSAINQSYKSSGLSSPEYESGTCYDREQRMDGHFAPRG